MAEVPKTPPAVTTARRATHRIGILLAGTGDASVDALRFLVLQMNRLQSAQSSRVGASPFCSMRTEATTSPSRPLTTSSLSALRGSMMATTALGKGRFPSSPSVTGSQRWRRLLSLSSSSPSY